MSEENTNKLNSLIRGDYVLATKYTDGDPMDFFCVGFFREMLMLVDKYGKTTERYLVEDNSGNLFREGGFRRCERIQKRTGDILIAASPFISDRSGKSLWYWRSHLKELQEHTAPIRPACVPQKIDPRTNKIDQYTERVMREELWVCPQCLTSGRSRNKDSYPLKIYRERPSINCQDHFTLGYVRLKVSKPIINETTILPE